MAEMPPATDLFGDVSPVEAAQRHEEYLATLDKSLSNVSTVPGVAPKADPVSALEALASNKSLAPDAMSGLQNALAAQRMAMQDIKIDRTHCQRLTLEQINNVAKLTSLRIALNGLVISGHHNSIF